MLNTAEIAHLDSSSPSGLRYAHFRADAALVVARNAGGSVWTVSRKSMLDAGLRAVLPFPHPFKGGYPVLRTTLQRPLFCLLSLLLCVSPTMTGCAAIAGGGTSQAVSLSSEPSGAKFTIKSSSGIQMVQGTTPSTVRLPRKNEYQIEIALDGYRPQTLALTKALNGWVWGNILFGWIVGFIVDFASGSANKLEPAIVQVNLETAYLQNGQEAPIAVVRLLDTAGKVLEEQTVELEPIGSDSGAVADR